MTNHLPHHPHPHPHHHNVPPDLQQLLVVNFYLIICNFIFNETNNNNLEETKYNNRNNAMRDKIGTDLDGLSKDPESKILPVGQGRYKIHQVICFTVVAR